LFLWTLFYFFQPTFFSSFEQYINFVTSTTAAAVQSKSNSHVTVYYQPVDFTSYVFAVLFRGGGDAALRPPFELTIAPVTYLGVVGVMGELVPRRWCQNDVQQVFTK
jgi:hypothetical protein